MGKPRKISFFICVFVQMADKNLESLFCLPENS